MNRKVLLMLFLCLCALMTFPVAVLTVNSPVAGLTLNMENVEHFTAEPGFSLCGDEIDTPGYPA